MIAAAPDRLPQHAEATVLSLVAEVYRAATAPERWGPLLAALNERLGAVTTHLMVDKDVATGTVHGAWRWVGGEHDPRPLMESYEGSRRPIFGSAQLYVPGGVVLSYDTCPRDVLRRSDFYAECLRPLGVEAGACGVVDGAGGSRSFLMGLGADDCLDAGSVGLLAALLPHVAQALEIHRRLGAADWQRSAAATALDSLWLGVVLLDRRGTVRFANREAERMLGEADGLGVVRGALRAADPGAAALLSGLVAGACGTTAAEGVHPGGTLAVARPSGRRPYALRVAPIRLPETAVDLAFAEPAAVAFLHDPETRPEAASQALRRLYHLTDAEARLAAWLASGESLEGYAEAREVTLNTVRTHLKRIFDKTGARRQGELVALLLNGLAPLRIDDGGSSA